MMTSLEWLAAAEPLLVASESAPNEHGPALRALVVEGVELMRELRHMQVEHAKNADIGWRRQRLMAQRNSRRKYGYW